tara:strand:- start:304 stop:423 length:120 start_codon:yes stop_codon:yes gene_type:complete
VRVRGEGEVRVSVRVRVRVATRAMMATPAKKESVARGLC